MVYISVPPVEEIDGATFSSLRSQVEGQLIARGLVESVNFLVTTKGVPLKVGYDDAFSLTSRSASVESELALVLGPYSEFIGQLELLRQLAGKNDAII